MIALRTRISLAAALVIGLFVGLAALTLERAFHDSATSAMQERLFAQLYLVMAATELDEQGQLQMPTFLGEPRLNLPGSGLYAHISHPDGTMLWRSASGAALQWPVPPWRGNGQELFTRQTVQDEDYFLATLPVEWESMAGTVPLLFSILEHPSPFDAQLSGYRQYLWIWLGSMALLLLLTLSAALAWGLRPLRTVANEVHAVETGQQSALIQPYPAELRPLTDNINALLHHERAQQHRYQHALADLAHSLKTPLAVLQGLEGIGEQADTLQQQVARMDSIVQHQLQRAATSGRSAMSAPLPIAPLAERLLATLQKVYRDKALRLNSAITPGLCFRADEDDLLELLGNLLDNACKWAKHEVWLSAHREEAILLIQVEDDGPGIATPQREQVLARGVRLDESTPGHGIGLTMVREIVAAYDGHLGIDRSTHGGACITVSLPS